MASSALDRRRVGGNPAYGGGGGGLGGDGGDGGIDGFSIVWDALDAFALEYTSRSRLRVSRESRGVFELCRAATSTAAALFARIVPRARYALKDVSSDIASGVCDIARAARPTRQIRTTRVSAGALTKAPTKIFEKSDAYRARARAMDMTDARGIWINIYRLECAVADARWRARWDAVRARVGVARNDATRAPSECVLQFKF